MTYRIRKLLTLLLLLGFAIQPVLAQAFALRDVSSPCPMQMAMAQIDQHVMQHTDCTKHADMICADCELCGHTVSSMLYSPVYPIGPHGDSELIDTIRSAFISITLPVDSPPPRIL